MQKMKLGWPKRKRLAKWHLTLGLFLGLIWSIQGLTGSLLVFHREWDQMGDDALTNGPMLHFSDMIEKIEERIGVPVQRITAVGRDPRLLEARYLDKAGHPQAARIDAASGNIVGQRDREPTQPFGGAAWRWIYTVHTSLTVGPYGRIAMGLSGILLTSTLILGLKLAWPKGGAWARTFQFRNLRTTVQKFYCWHRAFGSIAFCPLVVASLTGIYLVFDAPITRTLSRMMPFQATAMMSHHGGMSGEHADHIMIGPDDAFDIARQRFPSGRFMNLEMPIEHPGYYSVRFTLPSELRAWSGRALVQVSAMNGDILTVYNPSSTTPLNRFDDSIYPIHIGDAGGILHRLAIAIFGLSLPFFYCTGLFLWWRKRK
ncbi:PepSY-associated TM helix domain-containing protein [Sphingobium sp.]|uniref:PepSY-associated TM helix domain-containing protein n=1 Tax=Sphingobium sp. TaxID=1912891 RepID=UPI002CAA7A97|nr:PepSY-associated TM helix domain-containing protein [Sphingobium sp.]HUD91676.1 PepSY-associated TM helix domain-containing protein [Sphingobium sp.]